MLGALPLKETVFDDFGFGFGSFSHLGYYVNVLSLSVVFGVVWNFFKNLFLLWPFACRLLFWLPRPLIRKVLIICFRRLYLFGAASVISSWAFWINSYFSIGRVQGVLRDRIRANKGSTIFQHS